MPKTKSSKSSWPPILPIKYSSGKTAFQVAGMIQGKLSLQMGNNPRRA
jgi:hypothetical protein